MSQRLLTHGFKLLKDLTVESTKKILNKRITYHGYIFEVDLEYTKKLWESHNNYPLAPEKLKIGNAEKLVSNFHPESHFVFVPLSKSQAISQSWDKTHHSI